MTETTDQQCVRFSIDTDGCVGHGRCYTVASQWFDTDDVGYGQVKDVAIGLDERDAAEAVAAACPEEAITVIS